ncbi:hypothetical protein ERJ75_001755500 [Trypanosoma vivax]|nr:hypothetical protein ERJ75_001755500 [Trypanosoma vivax]
MRRGGQVAMNEQEKGGAQRKVRGRERRQRTSVASGTTERSELRLSLRAEFVPGHKSRHAVNGVEMTVEGYQKGGDSRGEGSPTAEEGAKKNGVGGRDAAVEGSEVTWTSRERRRREFGGDLRLWRIAGVTKVSVGGLRGGGRVLGTEGANQRRVASKRGTTAIGDGATRASTRDLVGRVKL